MQMSISVASYRDEMFESQIDGVGEARKIEERLREALIWVNFEVGARTGQIAAISHAGGRIKRTLSQRHLCRRRNPLLCGEINGGFNYSVNVCRCTMLTKSMRRIYISDPT